MVLTIFPPCIISCDNDICGLFARWSKQGVLCAQNPSCGQACLRYQPACRTAWTNMQHDSICTHDCTLQSLGTLRCQELAAVVLTMSIFCHLCIIQNSTAMLSIELQLQQNACRHFLQVRCFFNHFAACAAVCSRLCCVLRALDICKQVYGKQHTGLRSVCYGV